MLDDEDGGRRYAGGKDRAHWTGNRRQYPTRRNGNGGFDGSVSVSHIGAADKEPYRLAYRIRDHNNEKGVSTGLSDAGL